MMTPEQRAMAVRALRTAADKLEAGEDAETYYYCPDDGHVDGFNDFALVLDPTDYLDDGEWYPDIEHVEWGIKVPVEALRPTEIGEVCPKHNRYDHWYHYAQCEVLGYERPAETRIDCDDCREEEDEE